MLIRLYRSFAYDQTLLTPMPSEFVVVQALVTQYMPKEDPASKAEATCQEDESREGVHCVHCTPAARASATAAARVAPKIARADCRAAASAGARLPSRCWAWPYGRVSPIARLRSAFHE
eukprot:5383316-Pleurochrysis_carterae.AAC.2